MSLNIYSNHSKVQNSFEFIHDVEAKFEYVMLDDSDGIRQLLKNIEGAEYCNPVSYLDKGGFKRPKTNLSIGCKVAILAYKLNNSIIDMVECSQLDRANVINHCTSGNVLDVRRKKPYIELGTGDINVVYDGVQFDKVAVLNSYIHRQVSTQKMGTVRIEANPQIVINLDPGVYLIGEAAAYNKRYLYDLFRKVGHTEQLVGSFSYEDTAIGEVQFMLNKGYKVILFNRADMYLDAAGLQLMRNYAASGVILLDYKGEEFDVDDLKRADIYSAKDRIEVALSYS